MDLWYEVRFFFTALLGVVGVFLFAILFSLRWWVRRWFRDEAEPILDWVEKKIDLLHLCVYTAIALFVLAYALRFWGGVDITDF